MNDKKLGCGGLIFIIIIIYGFLNDIASYAGGFITIFYMDWNYSSKVIESNNADKMPINTGKTLVNSLSAQQNSIIQFAKETGSIKSRQVEELLGVKQRRARRILGELVNMGILERQGAYKSTVYVLKN
ncbi:hypothetical protein [Coprococcus comes]|uniref:hypothetical protein n=1 Tax=Coprococcus comes TaxID=410072 RepID=UPI0032BFD5C7